MNRPITTEETYHISNILKHYAHAKAKHPYFCDIIKSDDLQFDFAEWQLEDCRERLVHAREANVVRWDELLDCEKYEAMAEIKHGDTAHAVEELYDCIAVCLRTIDVLEGRQKLGKPETKGKKKVNCVKCGESIPISKAEDWEVSGSTRRYICPSCAAEEAIAEGEAK